MRNEQRPVPNIGFGLQYLEESCRTLLARV